VLPPEILARAATEDPLLGMLLEDRYLVESFLARGGMGAVYQGTDTRLQRAVAVKFLDERFRSDREVVSRFHREALSAAALEHPNIIPIYGVGEQAQQHYFVMKFVDGQTVSQLVQDRGRLPVRDALGIAMQVCDGLEHIHHRGYVHRDVKPTNVMLDSRGHAYILDFGILRQTQSNLTQTGFVAGTPEYMSPEQARDAKSTSARSDIYSLGVMLFEMLTGRRPFKADSAFDLLLKHVSEPPPAPSTFAAGIQPIIDDVVLRALEKDPQGRYASAAEMRDALNEALGILEGGAPISRSRMLRTGDGGLSSSRTPAPRSAFGSVLGETAAPTPKSDVRATMIHGETSFGDDRPALRARRRRPAAIAAALLVVVGGAAAIVWFTMGREPASPNAPTSHAAVPHAPNTPLAPTAPAATPPPRPVLAPPEVTPQAAQGALAAAPDAGADAEPSARVKVAAAKPQRTPAKKATIDIFSKPSGAAVEVGERSLGDTPLENVTLEPGAHTLVFTKRGHATLKKGIRVRPGANLPLSVKLKAHQGRLSVIIRQGGQLSYAEVVLDGKSLGFNPVSERKVSAGKHWVAVRRQGYRAQQKRIEVAPGALQRVVFELEAE
jgi:tRNA A-37 threonylcarbamoyl transferase component Bud32